MRYPDFKKRVLKMYMERLLNGMSSEKARAFNTDDFPELDAQTFSDLANMLKIDGYTTGGAYSRNFTLREDVHEV